MNYSQLRELIPKKSQQWTVSDVLKWLKFIQLQKYCSLFQKKSVTGRLLKNMDAHQLVNQIGIASRIVCKKLLNWIRTGLQQFDSHLQQSPQPSQPSPAQSLQPTQNNDYSHHTPAQQNIKKSIKKKSQHTLLMLKRAQLRQNFWYRVKEKDYRIGSDQNCQIQINGDNYGIEPFHVLVCWRNGNYYVRNIARNSNVFFKVNARLPVFQGMRVEMGSNIFQFNKDTKGNLQIKIVQGKNSNYTYVFENKQKISIGRKPSNEISFPSDITLSNLHCRLTHSDNIWYIQDLATTNGTWIQLDEQAKIYTGFVFKLGLTNVQLQCEVRQVKEEDQLQLSYVFLKKDNEICVICETRNKDMLFMPCNHCAVCEQCGNGIKYCVVCSQKVISTAKIYKS